MLAREDGTACTRGPRISKNPDRRGQRWKGRKERDWEKLAHITVCIFADTCTFAPRILEEDDYLHRDTSSLSRLVYLLIYFLVIRVYRFFFLSRLSMFLSSFFPSLPSLFFPSCSTASLPRVSIEGCFYVSPEPLLSRALKFLNSTGTGKQKQKSRWPMLAEQSIGF